MRCYNIGKVMCLNSAGGMASSLGPDQTAALDPISGSILLAHIRGYGWGLLIRE